MAAHAGQHDARQRQAVHPPAGDGPGLGLAHDDPAVERGVVRHEVAVVCPGGEELHRKAWVRRAGHVFLRDAGELCDLCRDGAAGVHKGLEAVHDLRATQDAGRYLDDLVSGGVETGGLCVDDHDLVFEQLEALLRALAQAAVPRDGGPVCAGDEVAGVEAVFHGCQTSTSL